MKWVMGIKGCTCDEHRVVNGTVQSLIQHCIEINKRKRKLNENKNNENFTTLFL